MKNNLNGKYNRIVNIIKFFSAVLVIFSHSFSLSAKSEDIVSRYSHGYIGFGAVAVTIFFSLSGYFITKSILKNDQCFFRKRIKKIFPCLFMTVLLTIVIMSMVSEYSVMDYFKNKQTFLYLLNSFGIPVHNLPGVFLHNIYNSTINGALWTISVEIGCYISTFLLYKCNLLNEKRFFMVFIVLCIGCFFCRIGLTRLNIEILISAIRPFLIYCFSGGLYIYRNRFVNDQKKTMIIVPVLMLCLLLINLPYAYDFLLIVCIPMILVTIIQLDMGANISLGILDNISYQMYLVGFPIQQFIVYLYGGTMNPYLNFFLSLIVDIIIAIPLWFIFDKKLDGYYNKWLKIS